MEIDKAIAENEPKIGSMNPPYRGPHTVELKPGADLEFAALSDVNLRHSDLTWADLTNADLYKADFQLASLYEANLHEAELHYANLTGASFFNADLTGADFCEANLTGADLRGANLTNVKFPEGYGKLPVEEPVEPALRGGQTLREEDE